MVTSMEAKYRHFPINHFRGGFQQVKRKVDGFTELIREIMVNECSYRNRKSRGKIASVHYGLLFERVNLCQNYRMLHFRKLAREVVCLVYLQRNGLKTANIY